MKLSKQIQRFGLALILAVVSVSALASHEANHRYLVRGYVLDASEAPLENIQISVRLDNRLMGNTRTDSDGYYSLQVHFHDDNLGSRFEIRAGTNSGQARIRGTRGDRTSERVHLVSFIGDQIVESDLDKFRFPAWGYLVLFFAALVMIVMVADRLRKRRRRLKRISAEAAIPKTTKKSKKSKRSKRKKRKGH